MKVILQKDMGKLGNTMDLVEVKDGYARNYLIPRGIAIEATEKNIKILKAKKAVEEKRKQNEIEAAQKTAEYIKGKTLTIKTKAGENGKLFGSITSMDIVEYFKKQLKVNIDRKKIDLPEPIKSLGEREVDVKLCPGVSEKINVNVIEEKE